MQGPEWSLWCNTIVGQLSDRESTVENLPGALSFLQHEYHPHEIRHASRIKKLHLALPQYCMHMVWSALHPDWPKFDDHPSFEQPAWIGELERVHRGLEQF